MNAQRLRFLRAVRTTPVLLLTALFGCGGGSDAPPIAPVSGTLTVKGQPKADVNVKFFPDSGGRPASGRTDAEGKFVLTTLNTGDGAPVGTHKVSLSGAGALKDWGINGPPMPGMPGYEEWNREQKSGIDQKYADAETSGLVYTVPEDGLPNLEIKIP